MGRNRKSLPGAKPKGIKQSCADQANDQIKDTIPSGYSQNLSLPDYQKAIRRACIDAYVVLKDFPSRLRFSYFVGSNGKPLARCERRAGT